MQAIETMFRAVELLLGLLRQKSVGPLGFPCIHLKSMSCQIVTRFLLYECCRIDVHSLESWHEIVFLNRHPFRIRWDPTQK